MDQLKRTMALVGTPGNTLLAKIKSEEVSLPIVCISARIMYGQLLLNMMLDVLVRKC